MKVTRKKRNILYCSGFTSHRMHRALVAYADNRGWMVLCAPWTETDYADLFSGIPIDGVISHLTENATKTLLPWIAGVPHVTLNGHTAQTFGIPGVGFDHQEAVRMVGRHFVELAFSNIAAIGNREIDHTFDKRVEGLSAAMQDAGLPPPPRINLPSSMVGSCNGQLAFFSNALRSLAKPVAIMASNDRVAVMLMQACWRTDLSIPAQVAICSFDNDPIACDLAPIPLSSVDTDPELQAEAAIRLLSHGMSGHILPVSLTVIAPKALVVRRSSGVKASRNVVVAKALAYIHQHVWKPDLSLPEIAEQTDSAARSLFSAFKRELSITPLQYITNLRIEKAQRLLVETNLKVNEIRPQCGFASDYQMYQAFKRTTGKSPGQFLRKRCGAVVRD